MPARVYSWLFSFYLHCFARKIFLRSMAESAASKCIAANRFTSTSTTIFFIQRMCGPGPRPQVCWVIKRITHFGSTRSFN